HRIKLNSRMARRPTTEFFISLFGINERYRGDLAACGLDGLSPSAPRPLIDTGIDCVCHLVNDELCIAVECGVCEETDSSQDHRQEKPSKNWPWIGLARTSGHQIID